MFEKKKDSIQTFSPQHISYIIRAGVAFGILSHSEADRLWRELYRVNRGEDPSYDTDLLWREQRLLLLPDVISAAIIRWQEEHVGYRRWERSLIAKDILNRINKASFDRKLLRWHWVHHDWANSVPSEITEETELEPISGRSMGDGYPR